MNVEEGTLLLRSHAELPEWLKLHGSPRTEEWNVLDDRASVVDIKTYEAEWNFFWLFQKAQSWALSLDSEMALETALRDALKKMEKRFNCAEVVHLVHRNYCGIHYCRITVSARHIQPGPIFGLSDSPGITRKQIPSMVIHFGIRLAGGEWSLEKQHTLCDR